MQPLLYLVHRIPYPPNKGDKIRSFNLLKALNKRYSVYLGAFVDDPKDWQYRDEIQEYCTNVKLIRLDKRVAKLFSLSGLLTNKALSLPYYKNRQMQLWVNEIVCTYKINKIIIYSSIMAQYVEREPFHDCIRIADFVDIDSDKWLQYSRKKAFPMSWIYAREARRLAKFEQKISATFQKTLFATKDEMQYFASLHPTLNTRLGYYNNGVDTKYFDPFLQYNNPYSANVLPIVYTGAMDYWANVDAVCWFAKEVLPIIRDVMPQAHFYIVGSNPDPEVKVLSQNKGVTVTGAVRDIRPYIRYARVIVAPIRIARGVQNKVLEGMAMARPVICTSMALEGIELSKDYQPIIADNASKFINHCLYVLKEQQYNTLHLSARESVIKLYNWEENLLPLIQLLEIEHGHDKEIIDTNASGINIHVSGRD